MSSGGGGGSTTAEPSTSAETKRETRRPPIPKGSNTCKALANIVPASFTPNSSGLYL